MRIKNPDPRPNVPKIVDGLIEKKEVNRPSNDYSAALRPMPGGTGHIVARQFKFDVREARKLIDEIKTLPKSHQGPVLQELAKRAPTEQSQMPRFGGVALSENAAKELNAFAKKLGVDVKFDHGQPRPMHPVG